MKTNTKFMAAILSAIMTGFAAFLALPAQAASTLIDVEFNGGSVQQAVGFAAIGITNSDYWNFCSNGTATPGVVQSSRAFTNLEFVDGSASGVGLAMTNATGSYGIYTSSVTNGMFTNFLYANGGNVGLTITNLSAGTYDFYFYGHGDQNDESTVFALSVGGVGQGSESTTTTSGWNSVVWQEGMQYVEFTNIAVGAGATISVLAEPGGSTYACLNGMQIQPVGPTTPVVTAIGQSNSVPENTSTAITLTGSSSDGGTLNYTVLTQPANGTLTGTAPNLFYLPTTNFMGSDSFTFEVNEGTVTSTVATVSISVQAIMPPSFLTNGLVSYWPFNGNALDGSGKGNNGNLGAGIGFGTDRFGNTNSALLFTNGTTGQMTTTVSQPASNVFTLSEWFNLPTNYSSGGSTGNWHGLDTLIELTGNQSGSFSQFDKTLMVGGFDGGTTNVLTVYLASPSPLYLTGPVDVADGNWHQAVVTLSSQGTMLYMDGKLVATNANTVTAGIGGYWRLMPEQGSVDDVRVYNVALASNQVSALYAFEASPPTGAPIIEESPVSQTVNTGTQVSFSSLAWGSASTIQWYSTNSLGTNLVSGGTNNTLTITANDGTAGGYEAVFSNSYGMATSAVAVLSVVDPPGIVTSPISQTALAGSQVTLTASATGTSDTVQWYLVNYLGTNALSGATSTNLVLTAAGTTAGGYYAVFHNSVGNATTGVANLGVLGLVLTNGSFETITNHSAIASGGQSVLNVGDTWMVGWTGGGPGGDIFVVNGAADGLSPYDGQQWIDFNGNSTTPGGTLAQTITTTVGQSYAVVFEVGELGTGAQSLTAKALSVTGAVLASNYCVPASTVWTQFALAFTAVSTNTTLLFKDTSTITTPDLTFDDVAMLAPPQISTLPVGQTVTNGNSVTLTAAATNTTSTVQWWFNATNLIAGATTTNLTFIANTTNTGYYSAVFSNAAGTAVTTPAALLTVVTPVYLTQQPQSVVTNLGANVTLTGAAGGDTPILLQWQFNGANIPNATNTQLTLSDVQLTNAGNYTFLATNAYGSAASSNAALSIISTYQIPGTNVAGASTVTIPVNFIATGAESVMQFSLVFDPTVLTFVSVAAGPGATGATFTPNTNQASSGHLGFLIGYLGGSFPSGSMDLADLTFAGVLATNTIVTTISFTNTPTPQDLISSNFNILPAAYFAGNVTVTPTSLAGDVWPRTNGNDVIDVSDWLQEARFVVGLDTVSNASEMQRADVAPRDTGGDGVLNALDLAQVGRYVVGLDPLTPAGWSASSSLRIGSIANGKIAHANLPGDLTRTISLAPATSPANAVMVQLVAQGDENSVVLDIDYNPAIVSYSSTVATSPWTLLAVNSSGTSNLVIALALPGGVSSAVGMNQMAQLNFNSVSYSNTVALIFANSPVACSVSDVTATTNLVTTYQGSTLAVTGTAWPTLNAATAGGNVNLTWPLTAANFGVQSTTNITGAWNSISGTLVTNGPTVSLSLPAPTNSTFYRLIQP